jgi:hypothetical protein
MNFILELFANEILPVLIIILAIVGNLLGIIVLKKPNVNKIGPIIMYKYLLIFGIINSYMISIFYLHSFGINFETISLLTCRLTIFFGFITGPISLMILVYISIERYISIKYPSKKKILNKSLNQHIYMIVLVVFNLLINSWVPFDYDLIDKRNSTNKFIGNHNSDDDFECTRKSNNVIYLAILNTKLIPYSLMITFTILLIISIFKSRSRVISNYTNRQNETFQRDIKFAITSLSLNIIFIIFNLPIMIFSIFSNFPILFKISLNLYYFSFSIHFYLLFIFNSIFRKEFLSHFSKCKNKNVVRSRRFKITKSHHFLIETYV